MAAHQREEARTRTLLAQACARIMTEEGVKDFLVAKRKAAQRLGISNRQAMPSNSEIELALIEYQRLFRADTQGHHVRVLRQAAAEAMRFFARFRPRLVGAVLAGTAGSDADVHLHLFAETAEEVVLFLIGHDIPFETGARRLRLANGEHASFPTYAFAAGEIGIDITVFPLDAEREAPRSPVDGRPMHRAGLRELEALLAAGAEAVAGGG